MSADRGDDALVNAGRYCASCGTPHEAAARFCAKCGASLAVEGSPAQTRPSPAAAPVARATLTPRRRGPPWGRIAAIGLAIVIVAGIALVLAAPSPEPDAQRLGLGTATSKAPTADRLVTSATWGTAPADQVLVLLREGSTRSDADRVARELGASVVGEIAWLALYQLETAGRTAVALDEAVAKAAKIDGVTLALANAQVLAEDAVGTRCDPLADPSYRLGANGRAYEVIGLGPAIDLLRGSGVAPQPVRVGVLDDAIAKGTGEFSRDVRVSGDTTEAASWDHGTEVAGLIGATFGNGGVAGVAGVLGDKLTIGTANIYRPGDSLPKVPVPNPADPTQVTLAGQTHVYGVFADAVRQIDQGATVVNMSFGERFGGVGGAKTGARLWREFLGRMQLQHPNVLFVASAGNANLVLDGENHLPGGIKADNLVTVGAIDNTGRKASFSNAMGAGGEVTLAAVGQDVMVGIGPDGKPILSSGTSFAAPQVTAAAALLRAIDPSLDAKSIKDVLASTAAPGVAGKDAAGNDVSVVAPAGLGGKILRVDNAVERVINDLRAKQVPPLGKIDRAKIQALAVIDVSAAQTEALRWNVTAKVPGVGTGGTDVKIESLGQGGPVGGTKHLGAAGSLNWPYTFASPQDGAAVTVTRLDTGACARVSFKAGGVATSPEGATPSPAPTGRSPSAMPRDVVERARLSLGWPASEPRGGPGRSDVGADRWVHVAQSGGATATTTISVRGFPSADYAAGFYTSYVLFSRELGPTTYRGLKAFRDLKPATKPLPGINRDDDGMAVFQAAAGVYMFEAMVNCPPSPPDCAPAVPQREIDALLDAAVALGLIPPGTLK